MNPVLLLITAGAFVAWCAVLWMMLHGGPKLHRLQPKPRLRDMLCRNCGLFYREADPETLTRTPPPWIGACPRCGSDQLQFDGKRGMDVVRAS